MTSVPSSVLGNFYPRHGSQGCKDQRHQMALPALWVGFMLRQTAFLKIRTTDTTPGTMAWKKFPQNQASAGDQDMFSNEMVLFFLELHFLCLVILSGYASEFLFLLHGN